MSKKNELVNALRDVATRVAQAINDSDDHVATYFDRTYNSGGADAITDADISSTGLTATQAGNLVTMFQQLLNFRDNAAVTQADYGATMNLARTDF